MNISINTYLTTNASNSFILESDGYIQGTAQDDPSVRNQLSGGPFQAVATPVLPFDGFPAWGGIPLQVNIPPLLQNAQNALGAPCQRATNMSQINGWSVFNQNHSAINSPQSPVPLIAPGMNLNYYLNKSLARIAVPVNPALVSLAGTPINSPVSWDFANGFISTYQPAYGANVLTAQAWTAPAGGTLTFTTTTAHGVLPGSSFIIQGSTPALYNGVYTAAAGTTGNTLVATGVTANPGASVTLGALSAGGGALQANILNIKANNCMGIVYDPLTGFATWNRNAAMALIQI